MSLLCLRKEKTQKISPIQIRCGHTHFGYFQRKSSVNGIISATNKKHLLSIGRHSHFCTIVEHIAHTAITQFITKTVFVRVVDPCGDPKWWLSCRIGVFFNQIVIGFLWLHNICRNSTKNNEPYIFGCVGVFWIEKKCIKLWLSRVKKVYLTMSSNNLVSCMFKSPMSLFIASFITKFAHCATISSSRLSSILNIFSDYLEIHRNKILCSCDECDSNSFQVVFWLDLFVNFQFSNKM